MDFLRSMPGALAKPEARAKRRARARRHERVVVKAVRALVAERDHACRAALVALLVPATGLGACAGPSEWAHVGGWQRARTRGMAAELRHTTAGTMMLCRRHHRAYDAGTLGIELADPALGADGAVRFYAKEEP